MNSNANNVGQFDITIFGQPVIDHVIKLQVPFRYGDLMKICKIEPSGEVVFKEGSWIRTVENEEPYFFGMPLIYPDGTTSLTLLPGKKPVVKHLERNVVAPEELVARIGKPIINLGGGGPNVLQILNQVFGRLSIEFIGAYYPMPGGAPEGTIDPIIGFVLKMIPPLLQEVSPQPQRNLEIAPIYNTVPVNIVIEGMRGDGPDERGILKSPFSEKLIDKPFKPNGKAIMVNTIYSKTLAINALCCAIEEGKCGVLALTESLCNNQESFSSSERDWIKKFLKSIKKTIDFDEINTLYEFILKHIIPEGPTVIIMNESELDHILNPKNETSEKLENFPNDVQFPSKEQIHYNTSTKTLIFKGGMSKEEKRVLLELSKDASYRAAIEALFQRSSLHPVTGKERVKILEGKLVHLDSLLEGFTVLREMQKKNKSRIYVTLGAHGSLCLDENDTVHYCPVTVVEGIPSKGKNAIGDTFAAMILAGEYKTRFHERQVDIPYLISSAAAAADALFYSGFESVSPAMIDEYIAKTVTNYKDLAEQGNYHELGPLSQLKSQLEKLPLQGAPHIRLGDIQRKDWFTVINPRGPRMIGHYSLVEKYGTDNLTIRFANGTVI